MKINLLLAAAFIVGCSKIEPLSEPYPNYLIEEEDWIVYEGTLPSSYGPDVHVELHLYPGTPGLDARYRLRESYSDTVSPRYNGGVASTGRYMLLAGSEGKYLHIPDRRFIKGISTKGPFPMPELGEEDLYLKTDGEYELIFLDKNLQEKSRSYALTRRTSPLFTVEGYFSVCDDTTDFYEKNTQKEWPVARLAEYHEAVKKYNYLAKEKFEGVYLKALAYTVNHVTKDRQEIDALVFKTILEMDSTARMH